MQEVNRWIDRYRNRVQWGEFLQRFGEWFAGFLFIFGTAVLVVRMAIPQWWPHVLWLAVGAIPATWAAWMLACRNRQSRRETVAQLDDAVEGGGLLMTLSERPDAAWLEKLPQAEAVWTSALPRLRPKRFATILVLPLLFVVGAHLVPLREASARVVKNTVAQRATQELEELLGSLEEAAILEEEEKKQLQEEIEKLAEETKQTPLTHEKWETVDALREQMRARVELAAVTVDKFDMAAAALAKAGLSDANELTLDQQIKLEKDVQEALEQLMKKGAFSDLSGLSRETKDALQRLMKNGQFKLPQDAEEREKLLDELREHLDQEARKLSELRKKCNGGNCEKCGSGECEGECQGGSSSRDGDGNPGRGGINRGRGDADMTWGDESDEDGVRFKETVLPSGFLDQPKEETVGIRFTAPKEETIPGASRGTAREQDPASGRSTWNRKFSPKHRSVVKQFFDGKG